LKSLSRTNATSPAGSSSPYAAAATVVNDTGALYQFLLFSLSQKGTPDIIFPVSSRILL
jgi:hypothetical protein